MWTGRRALLTTVPIRDALVVGLCAPSSGGRANQSWSMAVGVGWPASLMVQVPQSRFAVALLAGLAVDAAAGLAAGLGSLVYDLAEGDVLIPFVVACTAAALLSQAVLVPGWVLRVGPANGRTLWARFSGALGGMYAAFLFALMGSLLALAGLLGPALVAMLLGFAGGAALAVVGAQAKDPRAPPLPRRGAVGLAVGGAVGAWLLLGALWALGLVEPPWWATDPRPWWGALAAGPLLVVLIGLPLRVLMLLHATHLPPARTMFGRTLASAAVLVIPAAALLWEFA